MARHPRSGGGHSDRDRVTSHATVSGEPSELLLWLWGRRPLSAVTVEGDEAVIAELRERLSLATQWRLFVALSPSPEARSHLEDAGCPGPGRDGLRWTEPDGVAPDARLSRRGRRGYASRPQRAVGRAARRHQVLQLTFRGAGAFGSRRHARALWMGLSGDREPLRRLAWSVGAAARRSGIATEERAYRPHLTLARARVPMDVTQAVDALASYAGPMWTATAISLVRSHLGRVAKHETIASCGTWAGRLDHDDRASSAVMRCMNLASVA